jgi:hypothetical protein
MKRVIIILLFLIALKSQSIISNPLLLVRNGLVNVNMEYVFNGKYKLHFASQELYGLSELRTKAILLKSKELNLSLSWVNFSFDIYRENLFEISKTIEFFGKSRFSLLYRHTNIEAIIQEEEYFLRYIFQKNIYEKLLILLSIDQLSLKRNVLEEYSIGLGIYNSMILYKSEFSIKDYLIIQEIGVSELTLELSYRFKQEKIGLSVDCNIKKYNLLSQISFHKELGISYSLALAFSGDFF